MPRYMRWLAALAALFTLSGVVALASPAQAATGQHGYTVKAGAWLKKHAGFQTEFLGLLSTDGLSGACFDYGLAAPNGGWTEGGLPEVGGQVQTQMQFTANQHWGDTDSNDGAAAYKATINREASAGFRSDWPGYVSQLKKAGHGAVATLSDAWLKSAQTNAGPVKAAITATHPSAGKPGTASVQVTGNGNAYPGVLIKWSVSNAATKTASSRTSSTGTATLSFTPNGAGSPKISYSLQVPDWRSAGYSKPSNGHQHLIRALQHPLVTLAGSTSFTSKFSATTNQDCGAVCNGHPPVTFTATAGGNELQWQARGPGLTKTLTIQPGKTGTATFTGQDTRTYSFRYRVLVGKKWSAWQTTDVRITVVCPPWPTLAETKACACKGGGKVTATITIPASTRFYTVTAGGVSKDLTGGQSATLTTTVKAGGSYSASFTAYADAGHTQQLSTGVLDDWTEGSA